MENSRGCEGMISKLEQKINAEFNKMGEKVFIYHFRLPFAPFNAVTIANLKAEPFELLEAVIYRAIVHITEKHLKSPATQLFELLQKDYLFGVAICDTHDTFNRQRGRIIAKGRLLKHLKEMGK